MVGGGDAQVTARSERPTDTHAWRHMETDATTAGLPMCFALGGRSVVAGWLGR